ncbi:GGDEF domain-containing protein [Dielma fastidiosa]|uniref:GGDEF domain-containing protein n=1 Tax=Dielma fastidiosa TaxID=1034346 RepID=A0AB35UMD5_9FIRM|nr:GGDEF domain-containing protein [Dielma fastidiosa]MDY5167022.1 GGDEF domain-containing protein [Dielma fastidiosa]
MVQFILQMLVVIEMICINMITTGKCCTLKKTRPIVIAVFVLWSFLVISSAIFIIKALGIYGNGNGLFVLFGFLYLIPAGWVFEESIDYILIVICTSWIYTMFCFSISVNFAKMFDEAYFEIIALTLQSVIYLFTVRRFWRLVQDKFLYILHHTSAETYRSLRSLSISWFLTAVMVNFSLVMQAGGVFNFLIMIILLVNSYRTYILLYDTVRNYETVGSLQKLAMRDALTELGNRNSLLIELDSRLHEDTAFFLLFMDLDRFKEINDTYGHLQGDQYLKLFSEELSRLFGGSENIYRISGDEFIYLGQLSDKTEILERLAVYEWPLFKKRKLKFLGVSYGCADYPQDAFRYEELLNKADAQMYAMKESRQIER